MAFTSKMTKTLELPGEPGETVTIRKLSVRQREEAEQTASERALKMVAAMGDLVNNLPAAAPDAVQDPATKYDRATVLRHGIVAWTYEDELTEDNVLDQDWAEWAFAEILAHSQRSAAEGEA